MFWQKKATKDNTSKESQENKQKLLDLNEYVIKEQTTLTETCYAFKIAMSYYSHNPSNNLKFLF